MDDKTKITLFLYQLEEDHKNGKTSLAKRKKEKIRNLLREFGWTYTLMFNYLINNLEVEDYVAGPEPDYNGTPGSVWKFKKVIFSKEVYIKIKCESNGSKCMSFHES